MKMILTLFFASVAILFGQDPPKRELVTLDDIRSYKAEENNPLNDPFDVFPEDVALLKRFESALRVAKGLPKNLDQSTIEDALIAAIEDLRIEWESDAIRIWMGPFIENPFDEKAQKLELTGEDARKLWGRSPWKHTTPNAKDGRLIEWAKVRKVTPLGVNLMTEGGFKWIPFSELNDDFDDVFGWSEDMEKESVESRSKADAEAVREITESEAVPKVVTNSFQSETPSSVSSRIKAKAEAEWGTNFRMVRYEIKNQEEAYQEYLRYSKSTSPTMKVIVRSALSEWKDNWRMVVYEIKNQSEAKLEIDGR